MSEPGESRPMPVPRVLVVSDETRDGLGCQLADVRAAIAADASSLHAHCANTYDAANPPYRFAAVGNDAASLLESIDAFLAAQADGGAAAPSGATPYAVLFTGQGAQYAGMGQALYACNARFREVLDTCDAIHREATGDSLLELVYPSGDEDNRLGQTQYAQPALFAIEAALWNVWSESVAAPAGLLGHSLGEYTAAYAAGAFSLEDGVRLVTARGRLMQSAPQGGGMAAVLAPASDVAAAVESAGQQSALQIAGYNGPKNTVVSGDMAALDALLAAKGVRGKKLAVSHAFHSEHMDTILGEFETVAQGFSFAPLRLPIASNLTGQLLPVGSTLDAAYWRSHLRNAVRFEPGIHALQQAGARAYVELGPSPVLCGMGARCVDKGAASWQGVLQPKTNAAEAFLTALAALYMAGQNVDWKALLAGFETAID